MKARDTIISLSDIYTALAAAELMRHCDTYSIFIDRTGVNFIYFAGLVRAKEALKNQHPHTAFPLRGIRKRGSSMLVTMQHNNVPLNYMIVAPQRKVTPPPPECYRIHLTTPDPKGEVI